MFDVECVKDIVKRNFIAIIAILFGACSIVLSGAYVYLNQCDDCNAVETLCKYEDEVDSEPSDDAQEVVKVDIKGAVKKTGVYELKAGSNIQDALALAGGITTKGSTKNINLSKKLTDEMVIYVFTKDELKKKESTNEVVCEIPKCECETVEVVQCPDINGNNGNSGSTSTEKKVSINKATAEELSLLDGIGESKARAIIEYREKNGPFLKLEDLMNVSGIGEKSFEALKEKITL